MTKTIENKQTSLPVSDKETAKYSDLLLVCFNKPVQEGVDLLTMRKNLRIVGILDGAKNKQSIEFTEEDFKDVKASVKESKWAVNHIEILDFADYIDSL